MSLTCVQLSSNGRRLRVRPWRFRPPPNREDKKNLASGFSTGVRIEEPSQCGFLLCPLHRAEYEPSTRLLELGERVVLETEAESNDGLVGIGEGVGEGSLGGPAETEREGGELAETHLDLLDEDVVGDVEDLSAVDGTVVVDSGDGEAVEERPDVEHLEEGSLGGSDLVALLDELDVSDDLNGTLGNLGGDVEGLEEGGLGGLETSVLGGDGDVEGGDGTSASGGGLLVVDEDLLDVVEVGVGEDEADVTLDVLHEVSEGGHGGDERAHNLADHGL